MSTCESGQDIFTIIFFIVLSIITIKFYKPKDTCVREQDKNTVRTIQCTIAIHLKNEFQAGRMAQQVKVPTAKPNDLHSIPTWSKEKTEFFKCFSSDLSFTHTERA